MPLLVMTMFFFETAALGSTSSATTTAGQNTTGSNPFIGQRPALIYFVPLDSHARTLIASVVPSVETWLPSAVQIRKLPTVRTRWIDKARAGEWNGRKVADDLLADFKSASGNSQVFIMAVTRGDLRPRRTELLIRVRVLWWHQPQFAAVFGTRPMRAFQPQREKARLTKMMLRYIGEVVGNQSRSTNPRSAPYRTILGTPDLDRMAPTLPAVCRMR